MAYDYSSIRYKRTIYNAFYDYDCILNCLQLPVVIGWFSMNLQERLDRYRATPRFSSLSKKARRHSSIHSRIISSCLAESLSCYSTTAPVCLGIWTSSLLLANCPTRRKSNRSYTRPYNLSLKLLASGNLNSEKTWPHPRSQKQWVLANQKPLFSVDLTTIGGNVLKSQIVKHTIAGSSEKSVLTRNANYLLYQKCETFLNRRHLKARDAFDIHLLLSRGATLDKALRPHLAMKEFDKESIKERIQGVTAKLCTVELRPVLPLPLFEDLAKDDFESVRRSVRTVFSEWLPGGRRGNGQRV